MILTGKGYFLWRILQCEKGDPEKIANQASDAGLSHMIIKVADGAFPYNYDRDKKVDYVPDLVNALRARNISVWGWHYVYGGYPQQEAEIALKRAKQFSLDGYVVNAEGEYKLPGRSANAKIFMSILRKGLGSTPIALSSYRYPTLHREFPWSAFIERCDLMMPQVYWLKTHYKTGEQLPRSIREFKDIYPHLEIFPTGPTFKQWGWIPYKEEIIEFMNAAKTMGLPGVNFYSFDESRLYMQDIWDFIKEFKWSDEVPSKGLPDQLIEALNSRNLDQISNLYRDNAIHIRPELTIQGKDSIKQWYQYMLTELIPEGTFSLSSASRQENTITFNWQVQNANTLILIYGQDTIGLVEEKISYHYSFFSSDPIESEL